MSPLDLFAPDRHLCRLAREALRDDPFFLGDSFVVLDLMGAAVYPPRTILTEWAAKPSPPYPLGSGGWLQTERGTIAIVHVQSIERAGDTECKLVGEVLAFNGSRLRRCVEVWKELANNRTASQHLTGIRWVARFSDCIRGHSSIGLSVPYDRLSAVAGWQAPIAFRAPLELCEWTEPNHGENRGP